MIDFISCHSILENIKNDFEQLCNYVVDAQKYVASWELENSTNDVFEVPKELLEPLENLSKLTSSIFENTKTKLNDKQLQVLIGWNYAIASSYCFIQQFLRGDFQLNLDKDWVETKSLSFQFYFHSNYELRMPFSNLRIYLDVINTHPSDYLVPPFIPSHQDTLLEINHWVAQAWEFVSVLPEQIKKHE